MQVALAVLLEDVNENHFFSFSAFLLIFTGGVVSSQPLPPLALDLFTAAEEAAPAEGG